MRTVAPLIGSGFIVMLPDGRQAVVRHAWDGQPVEVVVAGTGHRGEFFDAATLTDLRRKPDRVGCCTVCGDVYKQHGDRTSHCPAPGCHQTFEGGGLWDAHRIQMRGGKFECRPPATMSFRGSKLRKIADEVPGLVTVGTWRGPKLEAGVFA